MSKNTFEHEIDYVSKDILTHGNKVEYKFSKVTATFKELDRLDVEQHKLAMFITKTFRKFPRTPMLDEFGKHVIGEGGKEKFTVYADEEATYDLTIRFIREMSVHTTVYQELEQKEILADAGAIMSFGSWLVSEKCAPFFAILHETSIKP